MKITKKREFCSKEEFFHSFYYKKDKNGGYSLYCDKDGNLLTHDKEYLEQLKSRDDLVYEGIDSRTKRWTEPAIGICDYCGKEVVLGGFTNTCDNCDTDYNMNGVRLAPRSQWGEETGESVQDILMADADYRSGRETDG